MKFTITIEGASANNLSALASALGATTSPHGGIEEKMHHTNFTIDETNMLSYPDDKPEPGPIIRSSHSHAVDNTPVYEMGPETQARHNMEDPTPATTDEPTASANHDSHGLPWDERIHASSKALNADGTWRKRRGVTGDVVNAVEAELRAGSTMGASIPKSQPVPDGDSIPASLDRRASTPDAVSVQPGSVKYTDFVPMVMAALGAGKLDNAYIQDVLNSVGVPAINLLANQPDKLSEVVFRMQADGRL